MIAKRPGGVPVLEATRWYYGCPPAPLRGFGLGVAGAAPSRSLPLLPQQRRVPVVRTAQLNRSPALTAANVPVVGRSGRLPLSPQQASSVVATAHVWKPPAVTVMNVLVGCAGLPEGAGPPARDRAVVPERTRVGDAGADGRERAARGGGLAAVVVAPAGQRPVDIATAQLWVPPALTAVKVPAGGVDLPCRCSPSRRPPSVLIPQPWDRRR